MSALITAGQLAQALPEPELVVLDVRWSLGSADNRGEYEAGHIPGARFVDLETELSGAIGPHTGRHPLPLPDDFQAAARRWGIDQDSRVVVYDDAGAMAAARAWWLLRHAGFTAVQVLDGGLQAWRDAGEPVSTQVPVPEPGNVELSWGAMPVVEMEELAGVDGVLLDSRATARYLGVQEPVDPVAGHIPRALNRPTTDNLDDAARFRPAATLRAAFEKVDIAPDGPMPTVYCGSGITASHQILALHEAGIGAALYPGSWSEYCSYPENPVATSDERHRSR